VVAKHSLAVGLGLLKTREPSDLASAILTVSCLLYSSKYNIICNTASNICYRIQSACVLFLQRILRGGSEGSNPH